MTVPPTSLAVTPPAPAPTPPSPVAFPLGWLLEHAAAPIQYRAMIDVARLGDRSRLAGIALSYRPAILLALQQARDGTWNQSMLGVPSIRSERFEGIGTINAVRRLLEYGWDAESPPLMHARRVLFRLLAEDDDPSYLYELAPRGKADPELAHRGRSLLREAAAAALAQAGYEGDPRLRGAARRITDRIATFLRSPFGERPFLRVGNKHVLAPEANPPSIYALTMLAHMPLFRSEQWEHLDRIYQYVAQPLPRQESVQLFGDRIVPQPQLVLGDMLPHRNAVDEDVPWALHWLELMARLGFLRRNEGWAKLLDRFIEDRDPQGVWHPHKGMAAARSSNPYVWPAYPLESDLSGEERWTDVTFRIGLIARLAGRPIELL